MTSTMRQEFAAGRLAAADYVVHLEREIDRLLDAYVTAAALANSNAIEAAYAMAKLEITRDALVVAHEQAWTIVDDMKAVQQLLKRGTHPAGSSASRRMHLIEGGEV